MWVRKESGGTTITHRNVSYEWPEDGSVADIPPELAADLLSIRGGGYSEAPQPAEEDGGTDSGDGSQDDDAAAPEDDGKPAKAPRKPRAAAAES